MKFLNKTKQSWIEIIIVSVALTVLTEIFILPLFIQIKENLSDKPRVEIYIQRILSVEDTNLTIPLNYPSISFIGGCGIRNFIFENKIKIPEGRPIYYAKHVAATSMKCTLEDGSQCYYYTTHIKNVGKIPSSTITLDGAILSKTVEFTKDISPKIKINSGQGFFEKGGFYITIDNLNPNETVSLLMKSNSLSDVTMKCNVNGKGDYCVYGLDEIIIVPVYPDTVLPYGNEIIQQPKINESEINMFLWDFNMHEWDINRQVDIQSELCTV